MKLSFSLPPKPSSKSNPKPSQQNSTTNQDHDNSDNNNSNKQYVTEFDATKTLTNSAKSTHVIPAIQNEWQPFTKKMKNLHLPTLQSNGSRDLQFELESESATNDDDDNKMSYGLNIRHQATTEDEDANGRSRSSAAAAAAPVEMVLLQKLKSDLDRLPDHRGLEEFEDMPVEGFGAALLAGYGWYEGRGIGRNPKGDVKVKEIKKRTDKEGLGFDSSQVKVNDSNREKEKNKNDGDGDGFFVGKQVRVIGGRDTGLKGTIVEKLGGDWIVLKLFKTREEEEEEEVEVKVRVVDIAHLGSKEEGKCLRKLKEEKESKRSSKRRTSSGREIGEVKVERAEKSSVKVGKESVSWLRSHIRVRVVSKDLKRGRLYLKKAEVVDVVGPAVCDISMDESKELIQGVDQELLETALPRRGGPVLVLYGKHKGAYGSLVERDLDRETGVVRDADSQELLNVRLEQIAEYIGDPSYLGY